MRAGRPSRHIEFHSLMEAVGMPGCPICRTANDASCRWLECFFHEHVTDARTREDLRRARGLCAKHTEQAMRLGDPLGGSILYADLLRNAIECLGDPPGVTCPCCLVEEQAASSAIATLLAHIEEDDIRAAYKASDGMCLPHLRQALARASASTRKMVTELEQPKLAGLAAECESFVERSDYRRTGEPVDSVADAWKRAARKMGGR